MGNLTVPQMSPGNRACPEFWASGKSDVDCSLASLSDYAATIDNAGIFDRTCIKTSTLYHLSEDQWTSLCSPLTVQCTDGPRLRIAREQPAPLCGTTPCVAIAGCDAARTGACTAPQTCGPALHRRERWKVYLSSQRSAIPQGTPATSIS